MNKKKGYPRKAYSFERVLKDLADDIGYENIAYKIINKKRSLLGVRKKVDLKNSILKSKPVHKSVPISNHAY